MDLIENNIPEKNIRHFVWAIMTGLNYNTPL